MMQAHPSKESPLFRFNQERPYIVAEVSRRVYKGYLSSARHNEDAGIEYILNDAAYQEMERLATETGPEEEIRPRGWWIRTSKRLSELSEQEKRDILRELIDAYADDVAGQFNPRVYGLATGTLPIGLGLLFKAQDLQDVFPNVLEGMRQLRDLSERIVVSGHIDTLHELTRKGTVLYVPTHSSNMDSILLGYSLYQVGLPPVTYGAGKNLFSNPMTSFFMHNLGAYKVDRRIRHGLYKEILKTYAQVLLERGYHSLFFPGGTRNRSNAVEQKLKLGLLGTSVTAYTRNLMQKGQDDRIFICPVTINYNLVLEAESLMRDFLRREGGKKYFLENDQFDSISEIIRFVMNTVRMDSTTVLRYGQPFDPFGNRVEADGESYDAQGRRVDPRTYVMSARDGIVTPDDARDREYTKYTGRQVASAFLENTVLMPTQVVSYALFEIVRRRFPRWDIYRLLRLGADEVISWEELRAGTGALIEELKRRADAGDVHLSEFVTQEKPQRVAEAGVEYLRMYHLPAPVDFHPDGISLQRLEVLYFYSNRVRAYDIPDTSWLARVPNLAY